MGATVGWAAVLAAAVPQIPFTMRPADSLLLAALAVAATVGCLIARWQRPVQEVYRLGYEAGQRDAVRRHLRAANVSALRPRKAVNPARASRELERV